MRPSDPWGTTSDEALARLLRAAERASAKAADARAALPTGSSRARVTTANARWMRAAEARDRLLAEVQRRKEARDAAE